MPTTTPQGAHQLPQLGYRLPLTGAAAATAFPGTVFTTTAPGRHQRRYLCPRPGAEVQCTAGPRPALTAAQRAEARNPYAVAARATVSWTNGPCVDQVEAVLTAADPDVVAGNARLPELRRRVTWHAYALVLAALRLTGEPGTDPVPPLAVLPIPGPHDLAGVPVSFEALAEIATELCALAGLEPDAHLGVTASRAPLLDADATYTAALHAART